MGEEYTLCSSGALRAAAKMEEEICAIVKDISRIGIGVSFEYLLDLNPFSTTRY
jgi:hypothetical protein